MRNKLVISLGHQYAFAPNTPLARENGLVKWVLKNVAPALFGIGVDRHPYQENILPPVIDINLSCKITQNFIMVYLPFEDQSKVTDLLNIFSYYNFIFYAPQLTEIQRGKVLWQKTC